MRGVALERYKFPWIPLGLTLLAVWLGGCGRRETAVAVASREHVLLMGLAQDVSDLDPHTSNSAEAFPVFQALYEGLVRLAPDGRTVLPGVAERWEISPDGLVYRFHLRADARWSNGDPVTAADFVGSIQRLFTPSLGSEPASQALIFEGAPEFNERKETDPTKLGVRALDDRTLELRLRHAAPYFLLSLGGTTFFPVHRPSVEAAQGWDRRDGEWTKPGKLIGNGPFLLTEWRTGAGIRVARNPHYWGRESVKLQGIHFFTMEDEVAEERAYRAGQLHLTSRIPQQKLPVYERERPREVVIAPASKTEFLSFNVNQGPFTDARVRRALALAIDRDKLVQAGYGGRLALSARALTRPGSAGYEPPAGFTFDPVEARRLLAEAGFPEGRGFPAAELSLNGVAARQRVIGEVLQRQWREVLGLQIELRPLEFRVYLALTRTADFQVVLDSWSYLPDPRQILFTAMTDDPNNMARWSDPVFDAAVRRSDAALQPVVRFAAFDEAERRIAEQTPFAPLVYSNRGYLVHPSVLGWRPNTLDAIDWTAISVKP